jgi:hypothetical protein
MNTAERLKQLGTFKTTIFAVFAFSELPYLNLFLYCTKMRFSLQANMIALKLQ